MAFAVFKLSYNIAGETPVTGGTCGAGFFISPRMALTSYHVMNHKELRSPNPGFQYCRYWILTPLGTAILLKSEMIHEHPEIDMTVLEFNESVDGANIYNLSESVHNVGEEVYSRGYEGGKMPSMNAEWINDELAIHSFDLSSVTSNKKGYIKRKLQMNVSALDVNLRDISGFETSFGGTEGMSGGPLLSQVSDEVIGLMSFGLPKDIHVKEQLFAISRDEIQKRI